MGSVVDDKLHLSSRLEYSHKPVTGYIIHASLQKRKNFEISQMTDHELIIPVSCPVMNSPSRSVSWLILAHKIQEALESPILQQGSDKAGRQDI